MVFASYKSLFALLAVLALDQTDAKVGVCYAPWRNKVVTKEILVSDLVLIRQHFSVFRTFETLMSNMNIIDIAAEVGVKIDVGVQLGNPAQVQAELDAVCEGWARHSDVIETVWVGNEVLKNKDFGTVSATELIGHIEYIKKCTKNSVAVGTVQRVNEWLGAPEINTVAAACDKLGINIYPFFTQSPDTPIVRFETQWKQVTSMYNSSKCAIGETGWPSAGEDAFGNKPSLETMQSYLNDFSTWAKGVTETVSWFQMFDSTVSYTQMEYEKSFGLFTVDGKAKVTIPAGFGGGSGAPTPAAPSGTPPAGPPAGGAPPAPPAGPPAGGAPPAPPAGPPAGGAPPAPPAGGDNSDAYFELADPVTFMPDKAPSAPPANGNPPAPYFELGDPVTFMPVETPDQNTPSAGQSGKNCPM